MRKINISFRPNLKPVTLAVLIGIVLLLVAIYGPALHGPFVFDDFSNIPQTNKPLNSFSDLKALALANNSGLFGRPIPVATFALNYHFWGSETTSFKIVNLTIHAINTVLIFFFVRTLLLLTSTVGRETHTLSSNNIAVATCLLWSIHPLHVSTVMYAVQRMTLLMTMFTLLAMLLYLTARRLQANGKPGASIAIFGTVVCTVLACFSKENGALLAIYFLLLELCVLRFAMATEKQTRIFKKISLVTTLIGCIGIAIFLVVSPEFLARGYQSRDFSLMERLTTQLLVVTQYLNLLLLPDVSKMNLYQDTFPVSREFGSRELISALLLSVLALTSWLIRKRRPLVSFGILFYIASQIMESTIIPLELVFEHRNYIGSIGLVVSFLCIFSWLTQRVKSIKVSYVSLLLFSLMLGTQTLTRAMDWQSEMTLAIASVYKKPESPRARYSLATALMNKQRPDEAIRTLDELSQIHPDIALPEIMAFYVQTIQGVNDPERAERIEGLLRNHPVSKDVVSGLDNLGDLYKKLPVEAAAREQILQFHTAASTNKTLKISQSNKAKLHALYSRLLFQKGEFLLAVKELRRAANINPDNLEIKLRLAEALAATSEWSQVNEVLTELKDSEYKVELSKMNTDFQNRLMELYKNLDTQKSSRSDTKELRYGSLR